MAQQSQYEGVMNVPLGDRTVQSTASAFDPKPISSKIPIGALPSPSALFSPDVDPSQGALPSGGGGDMMNIINSLVGGGISEADILKAILPVSQAAPLQMPASLTREIPGAPPLTIMKDQAIGTEYAKAQGIGNAISGVANILTSFKLYRDRGKQEADATKVTRLMEAQQGIAQAQQVLAVDPGNKQAQETIQTNQTLIQGMFQDPKFVKTVEKGFQVSLTDPSQNKTPEHGVVQRALDLFKNKQQPPLSPQQAGAAASRFGAAQPRVMAPSVPAQQMLQYKMAQQQLTSRLMSSLIGRMFTAQSADAREVFRQQAMDSRALSAQMFNSWKLGQQFANNKLLAGIRHDNRMDEITSRIDQEGQKAIELMHQKNLDPVSLFKNKTAFYKFAADSEAKYNTILQNIQGKIVTANADLPLVATDPVATKRIQDSIAALQYQYSSVQLEQRNFQAYKQTMNSIYDNLDKLSSIQGGGGTSGAGAGTGPTPSGQPVPAATPGVGAGAFDPNVYLGVPAGTSGTPAGTGLLPPIGPGGSDSSTGPGSDENDDTEDEEYDNQ